jgi:acyl-CoA dehydrogenase
MPASIDRAIEGGLAAHTVGGAFLAGYHNALRALVPELPLDRAVCLCATEEGGVHPRAIQTRLEPEGSGFVLHGQKKWVTGGPLADLFLVVASTGTDASGRNVLRLVRVQAGQPGVTLHPMPETPFTPEIPHAQVTFDRVAVAADALLPGDGYDRYLKPFRTVEDVHVHAAVLAYVLSLARRFSWPHEPQEQLLALLAASRSIALSDPSARETHLALAGVLALARRFLVESKDHFKLLDDQTRATWERDSALLMVAERARTARTESAWKSLENQ